MNLFGFERNEQERPAYWVTLNVAGQTAETESFRQLARKLGLALDQLGRMDYQLDQTFARMCSDLHARSYDNLDCEVAGLLEPGIRQAMTALADELNKAKSLAEEILADEVRQQA